ncbi:MAG: hypothetical protein ACIWVG_30370 [Gloeotrichia echinulata HAB0833]
MQDSTLLASPLILNHPNSKQEAMIRGDYGEMELWDNLTAAQAEVKKFNHRYPNLFFWVKEPNVK